MPEQIPEEKLAVQGCLAHKKPSVDMCPLEQVVEAMIEEGNMPSRDTYLHMLSVIAEGAKQVSSLSLSQVAVQVMISSSASGSEAHSRSPPVGNWGRWPWLLEKRSNCVWERLSEGNMPSRDTFLHMLSVIAEGAKQVQGMSTCTGYDTYLQVMYRL